MDFYVMKLTKLIRVLFSNKKKFFCLDDVKVDDEKTLEAKKLVRTRW